MRVAEAVETAAQDLPRARQVEAALVKRGAMVVVARSRRGIRSRQRDRPEHLELDVRNPSDGCPKVKAAGAVFLGPLTSGAAGRLPCRPQSRAADGRRGAFCVAAGRIRFPETNQYNRGVDGRDCGARAAVAHLARMEGFEGHARAMELRSGGDGNGESGKQAEIEMQKQTKSACKVKTRTATGRTLGAGQGETHCRTSSARRARLR